jgi:hypothetical protein
MAEITAVERLERARKSLEISQDRLVEINARLPILSRELEELIVTNEIHGYKGRTIEKVRDEIANLKKEKDILEQTIVALQKRLPELEKEARIEIASSETVAEYKIALIALSDLIKEVPALDELKAAVSKIQRFAETLENRQKQFFSLSQKLNQTMIEEKLSSVGSVDIETLRTNAGNLIYEEILALSDGLIDLSNELNSLQFFLFKTSTAALVITDLPLPHIEEECACHKHRRGFRPMEGWILLEYRQDPEYFNKWDWVLVEKESGFKNKPFFPCERKHPTVHKKKPELRPSDIQGQMVYNDNEAADKSITPVEDGL